MFDGVITLLIALIALAANLALMYVIVQAAVVNAMRRARREEWTETYDVKHAHWLTDRQRDTLRTRAPQIGEDDAAAS